MKNIKIGLIFLILSLVLVFSGCSIFEKDLDGKNIIVNSPVDALRITEGDLLFWWEPIDGVDKYNLQIVSPSFDTAIVLLLDTNLTGTKFTQYLYPGDYEWRVSAYNNSSNTNYVERSIFIDSVTSLDGIQVGLKSPANLIHTNDTSVTFEWYGIDLADSYLFKLVDSNGDIWGGNPFFVEGTSITLYDQQDSFIEDTYTWQVQAVSDQGSYSQYSNARTITIDRTAPEVPTLIAPANNTTSQDTVTFSWNAVEDQVSDITYDIHIYDDENLTNYVDGEEDLTGTEFIYIFETAMDYYWQVRSKDQAGNYSEFTGVRKLTIENN